MAGTFRPQRGGPGYTLDWNGPEIVAVLVEASRRGINDVSIAGAEMARREHFWENRTGQTEAAVFVEPAKIEMRGTTPESTPHVWGEWGVEDRPRILHSEDVDGRLVPVRDETGAHVHEDVTTKDVALFLEFGTLRAMPRPWLYPAWDATKVLLPAAIKAHYEAISATEGARARVRNTLGQFARLG